MTTEESIARLEKLTDMLEAKVAEKDRRILELEMELHLTRQIQQEPAKAKPISIEVMHHMAPIVGMSQMEDVMGLVRATEDNIRQHNTQSMLSAHTVQG